jgi:hypothetical protein
MLESRNLVRSNSRVIVLLIDIWKDFKIPTTPSTTSKKAQYRVLGSSGNDASHMESDVDVRGKSPAQPTELQPSQPKERVEFQTYGTIPRASELSKSIPSPE